MRLLINSVDLKRDRCVKSSQISRTSSLRVKHVVHDQIVPRETKALLENEGDAQKIDWPFFHREETEYAR